MNNSQTVLEEESFDPLKDFNSHQENLESPIRNFCSPETFSKLIRSTKRLRLRKPFNPYISYSSDEELEEWWQQPKTDYTYSASLSYRETVTPERRIGSPNMSRKGLRGSSTATVTSSPFSDHSSPSDSLSLRSRRIPRGGLDALSDNSDLEEESQRSKFRLEEKNTSSNIHSLSISSTRHRTILTTKSSSTPLTYGLDGGSDTEDESLTTHFARPIVRKGVSSYLRNSIAQENHTDSSKTSLNGKFNSRIANHVHTSTVFSENASKETREGFYQSIASSEKVQKCRALVSRFWEWCLCSTLRVWEYSSLTVISILSWISTMSSGVPDFFSSLMNRFRSHSVRKSQHQNSFQKTTRTITTTTVISRRQRVYRFMEDGLAWYSERRKANPCLWSWLPLLLLTLFLLLFIPWLVSTRGRTNFEESDSFSSHVSSSFSMYSSLLSKGVSKILLGGSLIYEKIVSTSFILFDWVSVLLIFMKDAFLNVIHAVWSFFGYMLHVIYSYISLIFSAPSMPPPKKVIQPGSEHWIKTFSPVTVLHSGYAATLEGVKYVSNISQAVFTNVLSYIGYGVMFLTNSVLWALEGLWSLVMSVGSFLWLLFFNIFNIFAGIFSKNSDSSSYLYREDSVVTDPSPSSQHFVHDSSKVSSEELVEQILASPRLQSFISLNLKENLNVDRTELKKHLASEIKLNLESEVNRIKSEILETQSASEGAFFSAKEEDIRSLKNQQEELIARLKEMDLSLAKLMSSQVEGTKESGENLKLLKADISVSIEKLTEHFDSLQSNFEKLEKKVSSCCQNRSLTIEQVEKHVLLLLSDLIGLGPEGESDSDRVSKLQSWFATYSHSKDEVEGKLNALWETHLSQPSSDETSAKGSIVDDETLRQAADLVMNDVMEQMRSEIKIQHEQSLNIMRQAVDEEIATKVSGNIVGSGTVVSGLNETAIKKIVKDALLKYDADKTGMVDHALESGGGSIISTRCTEGYQGHKAELTVFGYSLFRYSTNTPRSLIQPDRNPGQCYAFKGSQGFIVIQFAAPVRVTAFTYEHIPKSITPLGDIDSAPKEFSVYGLQTLDEEGFHFGNFVFDDEGEPLQFFPVLNTSEEYFKYVELKIFSNHGNLQYTCMYRFRVHGVRQF